MFRRRVKIDVLPDNDSTCAHTYTHVLRTHTPPTHVVRHTSSGRGIAHSVRASLYRLSLFVNLSLSLTQTLDVTFCGTAICSNLFVFACVCCFSVFFSHTLLMVSFAGLRAEDLIMDQVPGVTEALRRMPEGYHDERFFRIKRGASDSHSTLLNMRTCMRHVWLFTLVL